MDRREILRQLKTIFLLTGIVISLGTEGLAQAEQYVFQIRNTNQTLFLSYRGNTMETNEISFYGEINKVVNSQYNFLYLFQAQEYDKDLGVYYFPSRIYSALTRRFLQVDPKSQYHSPYLFVNADPVNSIDPDGKEGKTLVLFGEDHHYPGGMDPALQDLQSAVPDAKFVPLSQFINGDVGDLGELNGNVYIEAHMGYAEGAEINVERNATSMERVNAKAYANTRKLGARNYASDVSAEHLGDHLSHFYEERGVPLKNVIAGGCEGTYAAKAINRGVKASTAKASPELKTYGLKPGNRLSIFGPKASHSPKDGLSVRSTKVYAIPEGSHSVRYTGTMDALRGGNRLTGLRNKVSASELEEFPTLKGKQINDFVGGRMSKDFLKVLDRY